MLSALLVACGLAACAERQDPAPVSANPSTQELRARIANLERDLETAEAFRAVKRLQWAYGHYSEFGLWHDFADLFADTGVGHYTQGDLDREGIRALFLEQVGQGQLGLARGRIYPHISFAPVLSVAADGGRVEGRFRILALLGGYGGNALWFHGVYENAYVRERDVWKIDEVANAAQVSGTFAAGLSASPGDRPALAFHYEPDDVGRIEGATPTGSAEPAEQEPGAALAALERRLDRLDDEAAIVRLQHHLGNLFDRHEWDAVVGLFAEQGRIEHGLRGVYVGRASIRQSLDQFGGAPLPDGEIDHRILFQTYVSVAPDGRTARARVDELGLSGNPEAGATWTQGIYENTFIREGGEWRVDSLRYYPRLITDYALGWGADAQPAPGPSAAVPADAPPTEQYGIYPEFHIPPFHFAHPVTGRSPQYPEGDPAATQQVRIAPARAADFIEAEAAGNRDSDPAGLQSMLRVAEERARRAIAYDAVENLVAAYAFYLDECMTPQAASLFAESGEIRIGDDERSRGPQDIANVLQSTYCPAARADGDVTLHHVSQPVITVEQDGATARFSVRLWAIDVSNDTADVYRGGTLEGEARYEAGRWKFGLLEARLTWTAAVPTP